MKRLVYASLFAAALQGAAPIYAQDAGAQAAGADVAYNAPEAGNPILPGYFADPTVKKFGDTYYIYATTDGSGAGFGPAQLWTSKDFVNWTLMPMNWPDSHWIWAPDVMYHTDGKYYYLYCQPCILHLGVSETPRGPWKNVLGESEAVLVKDRFVEGAITLDGQTFVDDDGSVYMYWGTWGIYKGFGCGAGKLNPDMKTFSETRLIPNTEATDFFEAPFVIKRNGTYYFMYSSGSCHTETYRVQYATSDKPLGPYTYRGCILETNADGTVHGPGHHSILKDGDDYYMLYHRHDNPHSNRGFHRQLALDKMVFEADGSIRKIVPTHKGIGALAPSVVKSRNLALGAKVKASSYYDDNFRPEYAVDDNNGTLWRPASMGQEWIELDLGKAQAIQTIWTQFEYGTQFYQYLIETSKDGRQWEVFADKRRNRLAGSPMVDFGETKARYVRLTYTGGQKRGFGGALWNIKVFGGVEASAPQQWVGVCAANWDGRQWNNEQGMLGGSFMLKSGQARTVRIDGKDALVLEPGTTLEFAHPQVSADREHTLSGLVYRDGKWQALNEGDASTSSAYNPLSLGKGRLAVNAGSERLILSHLRYYNWKQEAAELEFDATTPMVREPEADDNTRGLVVSLTADDHQAGDTVGYIANHGLEGYFAFEGGMGAPGREAAPHPAIVKEIQGKKAFHFEGRQFYTSNFGLPATLRDNSPYTLEAWILNDSIALNECVADFTTSHDELEKIMCVNGTEPRCGAMQHYGWYEDAGCKDMKKFEGKWQHLYVCFDGRMERVYINDELVSEKDIQLLVKPSQFITLGRNAEHDWAFTGYLHSLKLWDEYLPKK